MAGRYSVCAVQCYLWSVAMEKGAHCSDFCNCLGAGIGRGLAKVPDDDMTSHAC